MKLLPKLSICEQMSKYISQQPNLVLQEIRKRKRGAKTFGENVAYLFNRGGLFLYI